MTGPRVLVVDDDPDILRLVVRLLERALKGDVAGAPDGYQALAAVAEEDFDVVVLDIMMPGVSGLEVLRRLRERGTRPAVIILTGAPVRQYIDEARQLGAIEILAKPFDPAALVAAVGRAAAT